MLGDAFRAAQSSPISFPNPGGQPPGWADIFGTSVAAPLFAGTVADAAQIAGHRLGVLSPALRRMHGPPTR